MYCSDSRSKGSAVLRKQFVSLMKDRYRGKDAHARMDFLTLNYEPSENYVWDISFDLYTMTESTSSSSCSGFVAGRTTSSSSHRLRMIALVMPIRKDLFPVLNCRPKSSLIPKIKRQLLHRHRLETGYLDASFSSFHCDIKQGKAQHPTTAYHAMQVSPLIVFPTPSQLLSSDVLALPQWRL